MFKERKKKKSKSPPPPLPSRHFLKLSEIQKATENFDESSLIRRGYMGDVYCGEVFDGAIFVRAVIKRLNHKERGSTDSWPGVERQRLYTLRHRNLVSLIGYYTNDEEEVSPRKKETILVYEYLSGGTTLKDLLHEQPSTPLSWTRRLEICIGVAHAVQHLHAAGVLHGDIRSSNVFLTETSLVPKVTDYGLSEVCLADHPSVIATPPGALGYVDHSFVLCGGLTMKSDVYSLAVLLLELLCRRPALDERRRPGHPLWSLAVWVQRHVESSRDLEVLIDPAVKDEISPKCLDDLLELSKRCLDVYPDERPDMPEVVARLESLLTFQERPCAPTVKELSFDDLIKATGWLSKAPLFGDRKVFLGWLVQETLAPSEEGVGVAVVVKSEIPPSHDHWLEEVNFSGQLVHPNIIRLLGCCNKDGVVKLLVYEHMPRSLPHYIHGDDRLEPLSWATRLNILIGAARGLAYLHTDKGLLCNFRCDDILLDQEFNAKLGGFGWVEIQQRHDRKQQLKGVFGYLKADYDPDKGHLPMNDVFSFGLVVLETVTAKHPDDVLADLESLEVGDPDSKSNKRKLEEMMDPRLQGNYSLEGAFSCMALALRCLDAQPEARPSWEEVVWSLEQVTQGV